MATMKKNQRNLTDMVMGTEEDMHMGSKKSILTATVTVQKKKTMVMDTATGQKEGMDMGTILTSMRCLTIKSSTK